MLEVCLNVFAERDENDLLSTWLIKGTSSYDGYKVPVINTLDYQLENLTIIQPGMLQRHQARLDCTADIAEALLTVFLDLAHKCIYYLS